MKWEKTHAKHHNVMAAFLPDWFCAAKERKVTDAELMQEVHNYCLSILQKQPMPGMPETPEDVKSWAKLLFELYSKLYGNPQSAP